MNYTKNNRWQFIHTFNLISGTKRRRMDFEKQIQKIQFLVTFVQSGID